MRLENKFYLNENWKTKLIEISRDDNNREEISKAKKWIDAEVPGAIHTDLISSGLIPDPFFGENELRLQWIGHANWLYKTSFNYPKNFNKDLDTYIVFEGLDTVAQIFLNGKEIGSSDNMFRKYSFNITNELKQKGNNLEIIFASPYKYARAQEEKLGKLPVALNSERVYIRKAQYSFGWDWGPEFATSGIWRPVYLSQKAEYSIEGIKFDTLNITENNALVEARITLNKKLEDGHKVVITLSNEENIIKEISSPNESEIKINIEVPGVKLWWPNNYGEQTLYTLKVHITNNEDKIIDESERKVGIRKIELKLEEAGKPQFQLQVNGKPVFAKGANWIPADSFIPRVSNEKYRYLIQAAKNANMNILRVWGGGFYENDIFYELCDELGLMVWQDFMFACASYPEHEEFINNVTEEVTQNINRLQHHACLTIWCGNNENEWIWFREHNTSYKEMPGYKIYHDIIPGLLNELDPVRPYWPSSPFGDDDDPDSMLSGNRHQWDIWSFWVDYNKVVKDESLFVTEFGFQSSAGYDTIKKVLQKDERHAQSKIFEFHNKQVEGPERLFKFMSAHLAVRTGLEDFVYLTQLNQGLALRECVEHWQSRFPATNGSIIWQLNDCWPVASWALIDSGLIPKLSYYMIKKSFNPMLVHLTKVSDSLKIIVQNNGVKNFNGSIELKFVPLPSGNIEKINSKKINIEPLSKDEIFSLSLPAEVKEGKAIIIATLFDEDDRQVNRNYYKELEWKYISLPDAKIETTLTNKNEKLKVKTSKPAFFIFIRNNEVEFDDNSFILLPGEEKDVAIKIKDKKVFKKKFAVTSLNQFLQRKGK